MLQEYKKFCEKYKTKLFLDKEIKENLIDGLDCLFDDRERISFHVSVESWNPTMFSLVQRGTPLITLDEEDLAYLYSKYKNKIKEEYDLKIQKLTEEKNKIVLEYENLL